MTGMQLGCQTFSDAYSPFRECQNQPYVYSCCLNNWMMIEFHGRDIICIRSALQKHTKNLSRGNKLICWHPSLLFFKVSNFNYTPRQNEVLRGVYCFHVVRPSVRVSVRASVRPSVTFCFFNILKTHWWNFMKLCRHLYIYGANMYMQKLRARGQSLLSYFPL